MAQEQDWYLKPQEGPTSKIFCRHCENEIGEVYTASQTPTGRDTGRSEEEITREARDIAKRHVQKFHPQEAGDPATFENRYAKRPPESGPVRKDQPSG